MYDSLHEALSTISIMDDAMLDASMCLALPKNSEDDSKVYGRALSTPMWHRRFHTTDQTFKLIKIQASSSQRVAVNETF